MAWNPEPEVAVARDYGKRFGFDMVIIVGIANGKLGCATYGKTRAECDGAAVLGQEAMRAVENRLSIASAMAESGVVPCPSSSPEGRLCQKSAGHLLVHKCCFPGGTEEWA